MTEDRAQEIGLRLAALGVVRRQTAIGAADTWSYRNDHGILWHSDNQGLSWWPDVRDPATMGCVVAAVREMLGDHGAHCRRLGSLSWYVLDEDSNSYGIGDTEAEAWLAAAMHD